MSHAYSTGQNVMYNSKCSTIFKTRTVNSAPAYLIREIASGTTHDNVLETSLSACAVAMVINDRWATFTYTGDNGAASAWIFNNLIKNIASANNVIWGPNENNTIYSFTSSGQTWTKNKSYDNARL